ncbi:MAG: hypothetical protein JWN43_4040 [Gammaproteobacteria bacterium]|nr:hypothetical protein [Gammaproteobacteria bacterium]
MPLVIEFAAGKGARSKMGEIVLMVDRYLPHAGGSRVYYHNLYSRVAESGEDRVRVLTSQVPGWREFDGNYCKPELEVRRSGRALPDLRYLYWPRALGTIARLGRDVSRSKPDVIHCGDLLPQGLAALLLKRRHDLPYLAYCHGEEVPLTEPRRFQKTLRDRIYHAADHVVAACEYAREQLLTIGIPEARITKILPGVDLERFRPGPKRAALLERYHLGSGPIILTVARLTPRKGHLLVLRALAKALSRVPNVTYVVAGTGPERQSLQREVERLRIAHAVRFAGHVSEDDLVGLYQLADIFVMMNRDVAGDVEGFGMAFLEASACGKPVIGGRSGGTAESIVHGRTGFRIDPDEPELISARLEELLLSPEMRQKIGEAGLRYAREGFRWSSRAAELRRISADLASNSSRVQSGISVAATGALL